jgi:hypothetical protein
MRFKENALCTRNLERFAAITASFLDACVPVPRSPSCGIYDSKRFLESVIRAPNKRMLRCVTVLAERLLQIVPFATCAKSFRAVREHRKRLIALFAVLDFFLVFTHFSSLSSASLGFIALTLA